MAQRIYRRGGRSEEEGKVEGEVERREEREDREWRGREWCRGTGERWESAGRSGGCSEVMEGGRGAGGFPAKGVRKGGGREYIMKGI